MLSKLISSKLTIKLIDSDKLLFSETLLGKNGSASFHHTNLHFLAIEMYKLLRELYPTVFNEIFEDSIIITI